MERLLLEDFRCFDGLRDVRLAPITVLVGENSTGKTSFLAAARAAWQIAFGQRPPNFNEEPFELGAFEHIAHFRAREDASVERFRIGATHHIQGKDVSVEGTFSNADSQPALSSWSARSDGHEVLLEAPLAESPRLRIGQDGYVDLTDRQGRALLDHFPVALTLFFVLREPLYKQRSVAEQIGETAVEQARAVLEPVARGDADQPHAFAPIRSQPQRTYDPRVAPEDSSGGHIPLALRQVLKSKAGVDRAVKKALVSFGKASGLFTDLKIRNLGTAADPFQIQVHNVGPYRNLIDVGYGVSQILPVMFDAIRGQFGQAFLFQQPEVHLHPKAQAEFATAIAGLVGNHHMQAIIETHSDFILDRLRIEARAREKIGPEQVAILYFEREGTSVKIHEIGLDDQANLTNVPPGFRDFFLAEQRQLLGL